MDIFYNKIKKTTNRQVSCSAKITLEAYCKNIK